MKALLFALIPAFEFQYAVPPEDVLCNFAQLVTRPTVVSEPEKGNQMPLLLRPVIES